MPDQGFRDKQIRIPLTDGMNAMVYKVSHKCP